MSNLLIGALGALLATNQPAAISNLVVKQTGLSIPATNDPVQLELRKVMGEEEKAQAEVDKWIQENQKFAAQGAGESNDAMNRRIMARFEPVRKAYEDFLSRHTNHAGGELAYAGFLTDLGDEPESVPHLEKALKIDPTNPAVWNNLANYYGHFGEPKKAFEYYGKAISLNPDESVYYQNFGTTVFLFRKDAMEYYRIKEQQVFNKALELYSNAIKIDPDDFPLATDVAQTYYGIKPLRADDALAAWTNAFKVARDEIEREGVQLHFARLKWMAGRTNEARAHLGMITNQMYAELKRVITKNLERPPPDWSKPLSSIPDPPDEVKKP